MDKFHGIIIASDIDGTLARGTDISKENKEAIDYFMKNGGLFTLATGRAPEYIKNLDICPNAPMIVINGTVVYNHMTDEVLLSYTFDAHNLSICQEVLSNKDLNRISVFSLKEYYFENPTYEDFQDLHQPINKIVFSFGSEEAALATKSALQKKYSPEFVFERSWNTGLEMRSSQSGKGKCLEYIKSITGAKTTIAIGDYENDRSLLEAADISYCPDGSHPEIMAIADRISVPCEENAVAHMIYELDDKLSKGIDL